MSCITEQVYEILRDAGVVTNIDTLSRWAGRCASYMRSIHSKQIGASTDALLVLYFKLHEQKNITNNQNHAAVVDDMQKLLWINIQSRVMRKLEAIQ